MGKFTPFVDREDATRAFNDILGNETNVVLLYANKGIGKTRFIEEYFRDTHSIIKVDIYGINKHYVPSYYFFDKLKNEVIPTSRIKIDSISFNFSLASLFSFGTGLNFRIEKKKTRDYFLVKEALSKITYKYIIHIPSIELIDDESLVFYLQLMLEVKNAIFLLEITDENSVVNIIKTKLKDNGILYKSYKLDKVDIGNVEKMFRLMNFTQALGDLEKIYREANGDLYAIIQSYDPDEYHSVTTMDRMEKNEFYLYYIIMFFQYPIELKEIIEIVNHKKNPYFYDALIIKNKLDEMVNADLIQVDKYNAYFIRDKSSFKINEVKIYDVFYVSLEASITYNLYKLNQETDESRYKYQCNLIYLFNLKGDTRLNKLFAELRSSLPSTNSAKHVLPNINKAIDNCTNINTSTKNSMYQELVVLSILCNQIELADTILDSIYDFSNSTHRMLKGKILSTKNEQVTTKLLNMIENEEDSHIKISLQLDLMHIYMKYKSIEFVNKYVEPILSNKNNSQYMEYNFILKNLSLYQNHKTACDGLDRCIRNLEEHKDLVQVDRVYISYASRLTQCGKLKDAEDICNKLLDKHYDPSLNIGYIHNNLGATLLLRDDLTENTLKHFVEASLFVVDDYDRLLIKNNCLAYYLMNVEKGNIQMLDNAKAYVKIIQNQYADYHFDEFLHIVYLNLYNYYRLLNSNEKEIYLDKLNALRENTISDDLKKYISKTTDNIPLTKDDKWYFMSQCKYRPTFLGYWDSGFNKKWISIEKD